jgi:hypothetical protein
MYKYLSLFLVFASVPILTEAPSNRLDLWPEGAERKSLEVFFDR